MTVHPKRLIQNRKSRLYLKRDGSFTPDPAQATPVKTVAEALSLCRKFKLKDMDIVLKFDRDEYDVRLEIGDVC
jgi:hypothetical protein